MSTAREAKQVAKQYGAEIRATKGRTVASIDAWSPAGKAWNATGCHCIFETGEKDDIAQIWSDLIDGMMQGVGECDAEDCDTCHPEVVDS